MGLLFVSGLVIGWFAGFATVSFAMAAIGIVGLTASILIYLVSNKIRTLS